MRDRVWLALAVIGFAVLVLVVAKNYNRHDDESIYTVDGAYTPDIRDDLTDAKSLYNQLIGSRAITCPVTSCPEPGGGIIQLSSIWGSAHKNDYGVNCLFITKRDLFGDSASNVSTSSWRVDLQLDGSKSGSKEENRINDLFIPNLFDGKDYIEIISPFSFTFDNVNSSSVTYPDKDISNEGVQEIVIVSSDGNCRITFSNVANWFCAGTVGTTTVGGTGTDKTVEWQDHYRKHHSVIGRSGNAVCTGGGPGRVIGYAKRDTTIKIEVWNGSEYVVCSLEHLIGNYH